MGRWGYNILEGDTPLDKKSIIDYEYEVWCQRNNIEYTIEYESDIDYNVEFFINNQDMLLDILIKESYDSIHSIQVLGYIIYKLKCEFTDNVKRQFILSLLNDEFSKNSQERFDIIKSILLEILNF